MKKIWPYLATFFMGVSTMAIIALKWFNGDDYKLEIAKIKSKKSSGDIITPIEVEVSNAGRKQREKKPKRDRKQERIDKRKNKA